jgi:hypothetical protein
MAIGMASIDVFGAPWRASTSFFPLKIAASRVQAATQSGQEAVYRGNPG